MKCSMTSAWALLIAVLVSRTYCQPFEVLGKDQKLNVFISTMSKYFNAQTDLVFVIDESGSVDAESFRKKKQFVELITRMFTVSPELTRVALVSFSTNTTVHFNYLSGGGHMCNFMKALKLVKKRRGMTHTKEALEDAARLMNNERQGSHKVMVVLSDGKSNPHHHPDLAARALESRGMIIFCVGTEFGNRKELKGMASSVNHLYMINPNSNINAVNEKLRRDVVNDFFVPVMDKSLCGICDASAGCYCGRDGLYQCTCHRGYQRTRTTRKCVECPIGTYSSKPGQEQCELCPPNSVTNATGSISLKQCGCKNGYVGNPAKSITCNAVHCEMLSPPSNGILHPPICNNTLGAECSFYCEDNFCLYDGSEEGCYKHNRNPSPARECLSGGIWSGKNFSCEKVKCPPLEHPPYGSYRCTSSISYFDSKCTLYCKTGYNPMMGFDYNTTCQTTGTWSSTVGGCKETVCKRLKTNAILKVKPEECGIIDMPYQTQCQYVTYFCKKGYEYKRLVDSGDLHSLSIGQRTCHETGRWLGEYERYTCKASIPPTIRCPDSKNVTAPPYSKTSDFIYWDQPTANSHDSVHPLEIKLIFPPYEKGKITIKSPAKFPIGTHKLVYEATDINKLSARCSMIITVLDIEKPTVVKCSKDIEIVHLKDRAAVQWEEPIFFDNSGNTTLVRQTHKSGEEFTAFKIHKVVYEVADDSNNIAVCKFHVVIKPYQCPFRRPPLNANLTYIPHKDGRYSVTCKEGYAVEDQEPETLFDCHVENGVGTWIAAASKNTSLSWPNCSNITKANLSMKLHLRYKINDCEDKPKTREIENQISDEVQTSEFWKKYCTESKNCSLILTCEKSANTRRKRETNVDSNQSDFGENVKAKSTGFGIEAGAPLHLDFHRTVWLHRSSDNKKQALDVTIYANVTYSCNFGQLLRNDSCVNCPPGSYHNKGQDSCELCPLNTYQHQESSTTCLPCFINTYTLSVGAIRSSDCLSRCSPGTFSETGLEQCIACPTETYQDQPQQTNCKPCSEGKMTWAPGAISLVNCSALCSRGSFSPYGLNPCNLCPRGSYQLQEGKTVCIACPGITTTITEGAVSESDCQVVDVCNPNLCENNGTCKPNATREENYSCTCGKGFAGSRCHINIKDCDSDLCFNNGTCVDGIDAYSCVCQPGFTGEQCEVNMGDCFEGACLNAGVCRNETDLYRCECPPGFVGSRCEFNYDDCAVKPCENGGTCYDLQQGYRCCCPSGFTGSNCSVDIDECESSPCLNKGKCHDWINNFTCECQPGFIGIRCESSINDCESSSCVNHGRCLNLDGRKSCVCLPGYQGIRCEIKLLSDFDLSYPNSQVGNYTTFELKENLVDVTVAFFMQTLSGANFKTFVTFVPNSESMEVINDALIWFDFVCGKENGNGFAENRDSKWHHYAITWSSSNGAWSVYCDGELKTGGDGVSTNDSLSQGIFLLGQDRHRTTSGFVGKFSQFNVWNFAMVPSEIQRLADSCGFVGNVIAWPNMKRNVTVKEVSDLCQSKAMCGKLEAECHCHENNIFNANRCEKHVDTCSPNPCQNDQVCITEGTSKYCNCSSGFKGKFCQFDINECDENNGQCEFGCVNTFGSYYCWCKNGFALASDRHSCEPVAHCHDVGGHVYAENDEWDKKCKKCTCSKGKIHCRHHNCTKQLNCAKDERKGSVPGRCCPICIPVPDGNCTLSPNNELRSFDGNIIKLTNTCHFVIAQDCVHANFSISVESSDLYQTKKQIQVFAHCTNITVSIHGLVFVNGKKVKLPFTELDVVNIQSVPNMHGTAPFNKMEGILISLKENVEVFLSPDTSVSIGVPKAMQLKTCGLCGNFNGVMQDDLAMRNYLPAETVTDFVLNWQVDDCLIQDYKIKPEYPRIILN